jgi:hypothetical protein
VIHVTFKTFAGTFAPRVNAMLVTTLAADIAINQSFQADMLGWDPEHNRPILMEVKQYRSPMGRFSLRHELAHLWLSYGDSGQTNAPREDDSAKQLIYERMFAELLTRSHGMGEPEFANTASRVTGASKDSSRGIRSDEPAWLSWSRGRFESRLRRLPALMTIGLDGSAPFDVIVTNYLRRSSYLRRLSVTFGTTQLARDYRDSQLRLASSVLAALRLMLARLVSAFAHQPMAPAWLLVMLASARHYGHRSEPGHRSLLPSVPKPPVPMGAACLVT